jgi:hydroxymethylbilane synthase
MTMMRGNVHSRLDKIRHGECAASLLAMAGLRRLGLEAEASVALSPTTMLPAACQGIVGITAREDATELCELLKIVEDRAARVAATAERSLLGTLDGSCSTPIGAFGQLLPGNRLRLSGLLASVDGSFLCRGELEGNAADAARMGAELGASLKRGAPASVFA